MNATRELFSHGKFLNGTYMELWNWFPAAGRLPNVFIMPTAQRYDDLIKLLITSLIVLNARALVERGNERRAAERHSSQTVDKYTPFLANFYRKFVKY